MRIPKEISAHSGQRETAQIFIVVTVTMYDLVIAVAMLVLTFVDFYRYPCTAFYCDDSFGFAMFYCDDSFRVAMCLILNGMKQTELGFPCFFLCARTDLSRKSVMTTTTTALT